MGQKRRFGRAPRRLPVFTDQRAFSKSAGMSQRCQNRKSHLVDYLIGRISRADTDAQDQPHLHFFTFGLQCTTGPCKVANKRHYRTRSILDKTARRRLPIQPDYRASRSHQCWL
jgi:hypothetical protein